MKSFFLSFRYFIPALIITVALGFYLGLKQSPELSNSDIVPTSPPVSSDSLTSSPSSISSTPPLPPPDFSTNEPKRLPVISPKQTGNGTDDNYELSSVSPNPPSFSSQSTRNELPTHLFYQENAQNLVEIGTFYDRKEFLNLEAAEAFKQMKLAAQKDGIELIAISGFRSVSDQKKLFERQIQRKGSKQVAARLSAPPGFSEHHTGYALDIWDGKSPETLLKSAFESTQAYRWLKAHAAQYGFELSFPANNPQGVSYEPWHWRFVGSPNAIKIFADAKNLKSY